METRFFTFLLFSFTFNLIIIETQQQQHHHQEQSSGDSFSGDDGSDENDEVTESTRTEGSGSRDLEGEHTVLTACQKQRAIRPGSTSTSAFRPQCTSDGKFKPTQCDAKQCWCVNKDGIKMSGTENLLPKKPKCSGKDSEIVVVTRSPPAAVFPDLEPEERITDDITIDEPSTLRPDRPNTRKMPKTQSTTVSDADDGSAVRVSTPKPTFFSFLFRDPLIFAAIVGGVVLALMCIVLLVMFTIYRMRKKDEGSYALDEPKKSYGFAYTRARDKEFFA